MTSISIKRTPTSYEVTGLWFGGKCIQSVKQLGDCEGAIDAVADTMRRVGHECDTGAVREQLDGIVRCGVLRGNDGGGSDRSNEEEVV